MNSEHQPGAYLGTHPTKKFYVRISKILIIVSGLIGASSFQLSASFADNAPPPSVASPAAFKLGILANRGKKECGARWKGTLEYLNAQKSGIRFEMVPLEFNEIDAAVKFKRVDFLLANSFYLSKYEVEQGVQALANLSTTPPGPAEGMLGAVIFTRSDRQDIRTLQDLKGKSFVASNLQSVGWIATLRELKAAGLNVKHDFSKLVTVGENDRVVELVREGVIDAGTVRTGIFEQLFTENKERRENFKFLNLNPMLPFIGSTRLYPEWSLMRLSHVPAAQGRLLTKQLLLIPEDGDVARSGKYYSWIPAMNNVTAEGCLKDLKLPPYEAFGRIQIIDVVQNYWPWLVVLAAGAGAIGLMFLILMFAGGEMDPEVRHERAPWLIWVLFGLLGCGIMAGARWYYLDQKNSVLENREVILATLASNVAQRISDWYHETSADLSAFSADTAISDDLLAILKHSGEASNYNHLNSYFSKLSLREDIDNVTLLDSSAQLLWTLDIKQFQFTQNISAKNIPLFLESSQAMIAGPYYDAGGKNPKLHFVLSMHLNHQPKVPLGVLIFSCDLEKRLFPILNEWPFPSQSGEMILTQKNGDHILFMNQPRLAYGRESPIKISSSDLGKPAAMAGRGMEGEVQSEDYRGVKVLAIIKNLPDVPWSLIVKLDLKEVYQDLETRHWLMIAMTAVSLLLLWALTSLVLSFRDKRSYRKLYEIEKELSRQENRFGSIVEASVDLIFRMDLAGKIRFASPAAKTMLGIDRMDMIGRNFLDYVAEEDRVRASEGFERLQKGVAVRNLNLRLLQKNKSYLETEVNAGAILEGDEVGQIQGVIRDISIQKNYADELNRQKEEFKRLTEGLRDVVLRISVTGILEYVSPVVTEMGGYDPQEEVGQFIGKYFADPRELPKALDLIRSMAIEKKSAATCILFKPKHKAPFYVEVTGQPVLKDGQVTAFHCVMRDISERVKVENELRQRESTLHVVTSSAQEAIVMMDGTGAVTFWNPSAERMFGWKGAEAFSKNLYQLIAPDRHREAYLEGFTNFKNSGKVSAAGKTLEMPVRTKSGKEITVELSLSAVELDGHWNAVGVMRDITQRKQHEEQIKLQSTALEAAANGVAIVNLDGSILWVNPAFEKMTGYTLKEAVGKNPRLLKSGKHDAAFYHHMWQVLLKGDIWQGEIINKKKDGRLYTEEMTITPVQDDRGVSHFVAIKQDITAKKQIQEQLERAQRMESVGMMAGGVAHDFNNILTVISGYLELMMMNEQTRKNHAAELAEVQSAVRKAIDLVKRLLVFSRKEVLSPKVFSPKELVKDLENMLRRLVSENVHFVVRADQNTGNIKADPSQVEQVLVNLVANARDAMPKGGRIVIDVENVTLDEGYSEHYGKISAGEYVMIAVNDNGEGMTEEIKSRLFEPFFTTKPRGKGTGLGLPMCFGVMRQCHGHISVYSEVGHGTAIKLCFPRILDAEEKLICQKSQEALPAGRETILFVEDEESLRKLGVTILTQLGYRVFEAEHGLKALELMETHDEISFDLVVTDVIMPKMSGRDLADELWRARPNQKILFISGYTDDAMVRHGVLSGAIHFLQKPFTRRGLAFKVREALDTKRVRSEQF